MIEQRVTLRYGAQQIPAIVQAVQGDTGRDVIFELADYEIPAGATANYYIDKPDDTAIYNSAEVISSTEILAHLTEQALAAPGRNNGQVRILSDGEVITSFDFVLEVEAFRGLMRMQSETEVNIFDEALQAAAEDAIEEIQAQTPVVTGMQNSIAPTYSSSSTYDVGDYVMYNAQLYKCNTAITTAEAWTAAHWTLVPLATDVSNLKSALTPVSVLDFAWRNGTAFNVGNTKYITNDDIIPVNGASKLIVYFNMELSTGEKSVIYLVTFSISSGKTVNSRSYVIRNDVEVITTKGRAEYEFSDNELGYVVYFGKTNESHQELPVRLNTIDTKQIKYIMYNSWSELEKIKIVDNKASQAVMNCFSVSSGSPHSSATDTVKINISNGEKFYVTAITNGTDNSYFTVFQNPNSESSASSAGRIQANTGRKEFTASVNITEIGMYIGSQSTSFNVKYLVETKDSLFQFPYGWDELLKDEQEKIINYIADPALASVGISWRNGSAFNVSNPTYIAPTNIIPIMDAQKLVMYADIDLSEGEKVEFLMCTFSIDSGVSANSGNYRIRNDVGIISAKKLAVYEFEPNEKGFVIYLAKQDSSGNTENLRITDVDVSKLKMVRYYYNDAVKEDLMLKNLVNMSRHIPGNGSTKPLTLLHFSDIHADIAALKRIIKKSYNYSELIDDMICTGDMVANNYGSITGWWDSRVLTCIGNHDSASYSEQSGYNWTYLTMAQRSEYYIEPFEANWGIVHTAGTSYYYKDYPESKVRMIVMDGMLYTNAGEEATAQTAWLADLFDDTLDSNDSAYGYHVLIAIHAPHGGATAVDCTFSKRNQGTMPTHADCNTPQDVVDVVSAKITAGCKFVGYLVGHTHQDNIWDCEGDGKQRMYCVTCAAVAQKAQWEGSDQHRDADMDAFNIVTIDAVNGLVKIIRGGGANSDYYMRNRKQIGFYYINGNITGQDA